MKIRIALISALIISATIAPISQAANSPKFTLKAKLTPNFKYMPDLLKSFKTDGLDCTNYVKNTSGVLGVREEGDCKFNGQNLTVDLFPDEKTAAALIDSLKSFGGYFIGTGNWAIYLEDGATAKLLSNGLKLKTY